MPTDKDTENTPATPSIEPKPLNKYQKMLMEQQAAKPLMRPEFIPATWGTVLPDGRRVAPCPTEHYSHKYRPNCTIRVPRIAEILGIPESRALAACHAGGLQPHMNDTFMELAVVMLRESWDAGKTEERTTLADIAPDLGMSVAQARRLLVDRRVSPVDNHGKPLLFRRREVEPLIAEAEASRSAVVDDVDVFEVAEALEVSVIKAREITATWPVVGRRALAQGAPRRTFARSRLDEAVSEAVARAEAAKVEAAKVEAARQAAEQAKRDRAEVAEQARQAKRDRAEAVEQAKRDRAEAAEQARRDRAEAKIEAAEQAKQDRAELARVRRDLRIATLRAKLAEIAGED